MYMEIQSDINQAMRAILVDWLVEVTDEFRLRTETFYLTVNYIDRYLSQVKVRRTKLQLVGVTCMLIAAKCQELSPPDVEKFVYITDFSYTTKQILQMETMVLKQLSFEVTVATAYDCLQRFVSEASCVTMFLCRYLCELTQQEYSFLKYRPSMVAAASLRLALHTMSRVAAQSRELPTWSPQLTSATGYSAKALTACVADLHDVYRKAEANSLQGCRDRYSETGRLCVSAIMPPDAVP